MAPLQSHAEMACADVHKGLLDPMKDAGLRLDRVYHYSSAIKHEFSISHQAMSVGFLLRGQPAAFEVIQKRFEHYSELKQKIDQQTIALIRERKFDEAQALIFKSSEIANNHQYYREMIEAFKGGYESSINDSLILEDINIIRHWGPKIPELLPEFPR